MKLVSVLMSTYKEPIEYIQNSVNSILNQTYQEIEFVIIVDYPDNRLVVEYLSKLKNLDSRIKLYINEKNLGLVESLNRGLCHCVGEYIARMDADDFSLPERIEKQVTYLEKNDLDIVASAYERFNDCGIDAQILYFPQNHDACIKQLKWSNCVPHPAWLLRKEVYEACAGYRNIKGCEDYDFILRAVAHGFKVGNFPEVLLKYRFHVKSISRRGSIEQSVISDFLAYNYRKNLELSMDTYNDYLGSKAYDKCIAAEEHLQSCIALFKRQRQGIKKILCAFRVLFNPLFLKKRAIIILYYNRNML